MTTTLIYLHGFLSSPVSQKGLLLKKEAEKRSIAFYAPDLNCEPKKTRGILEAICQNYDAGKTGVVGSSLGGFYATWLYQRFGARTVLLNPATHPWDVVNEHLGSHVIESTGKTIDVNASYADDLRDMRVDRLDDMSNLLLFLSTNDEVLHWQEAKNKYRDARQILLPGEDHRISHFETVVDAVVDFALGSNG